jgi:hypothetical protein
MIEDEILIACSRLNFGMAERDRLSLACAPSKVDWEVVHEAAVAHKVGPLVYRNLQGCPRVHECIPTKVVHDFRVNTRTTLIRNLAVVHAVAEITAYFEARSHDVMLLKHAALFARQRGLFDVTMNGDVDVVVRPTSESTDGSGERYRWSSYSIPDPTWEVIDGFALSDSRSGRALSLEIDNRLHHDIVWNGVVPVDFRRIWNDAQRTPIGPSPALVPDVHDMIIVSTVNVFRKPFLSLKSMIELHELVRLGSDLDWSVLAEKARDYQCTTLVYAALHAARAMLGSDLFETGLGTLRPRGLSRRALDLVDRHVLPTSVCRLRRSRSVDDSPRRRPSDVVRRFLALDTRQRVRFLWHRVIIPRVVRAKG